MADLALNMKILVVHQENQVRSNLATWLRCHGHDAIEVESIDSMWNVLKGDHIDLALVDADFEGDITVQELNDSMRPMFPHVHPHLIMQKVGREYGEPVSSRFLCGVINAVWADTRVIRLAQSIVEDEEQSHSRVIVVDLEAGGDWERRLNSLLKPELEAICREIAAIRWEFPASVLMAPFNESAQGGLQRVVQWIHKHVFHADQAVRLEILYLNQSGDSKEQVMEQIAETGFDGIQQDAMLLRPVPKSHEDLEQYNVGLCAIAVSKRLSLLESNVRDNPSYRPIRQLDSPKEDPTESEIVVCLFEGNDIVGLINVEADRQGLLTEKSLAILEEMAPTLALLLKAEVDHQHHRLVAEATERLAECRVVNELLATLLDEVLKLDVYSVTYKSAAAAFWVSSEAVGSDAGGDSDTLAICRGATINKSVVDNSDKVPQLQMALLRQKKGFHWKQGDDPTLHREILEFAEAGQPDFAIRSSFSLALPTRQPLAVIVMESPRVAITERYQKAIRALARHAANHLELQLFDLNSTRKKLFALLGAIRHRVKNVSRRIDDHVNSRELDQGLRELIEQLTKEIPNDITQLENLYGQPSTMISGEDIKMLALRSAVRYGVEIDLTEIEEGFQTTAPKLLIEYIFDNLIGNTSKHSPGCRAHLVIRRIKSEYQSPERQPARSEGTSEQELYEIVYFDEGTAPPGWVSNDFGNGEGVILVELLTARLVDDGWEGPDRSLHVEYQSCHWRFTAPGYQSGQKTRTESPRTEPKGVTQQVDGEGF